MRSILGLFVLLQAALVSDLEAWMPDPATVRVLTYNIHHGEGLDGKLDLERIARVIRDQKPDLVALQEVDWKTTRTGGVDQAAELARLTGMHAVFGKAMDFAGGAYGQALLSKTRPGPLTIHRLPGTGEPRIAVEIPVTTATGFRLRMVGVHLDHQQPDRRLQQAIALRGALKTAHAKDPLPAILTGDFNDIPDSLPLQTFTTSGWTAISKAEPRHTSPANQPRKEIDHILTIGLAPNAPATVLPEATASDHRPVFVVLKAVP